MLMMRVRETRRFLLVLILLVATTNLPLDAQIGGSANLGGAVTDDSGGALPGVNVTVTNTVTDRARGMPPTVGRGNLQAQLDAINTYRASLNLAPFTLDRLEVLPPAKNIDIRVTKGINVGGARRVELFAEAFNVTNFVNRTGGIGDVRLATFNVPTGAQDARQVQWGARYAF